LPPAAAYSIIAEYLNPTSTLTTSPPRHGTKLEVRGPDGITTVWYLDPMIATGVTDWCRKKYLQVVSAGSYDVGWSDDDRPPDGP